MLLSLINVEVILRRLESRSREVFTFSMHQIELPYEFYGKKKELFANSFFFLCQKLISKHMLIFYFNCFFRGFSLNCLFL